MNKITKYLYLFAVALCVFTLSYTIFSQLTGLKIALFSNTEIAPLTSIGKSILAFVVLHAVYPVEKIFKIKLPSLLVASYFIFIIGATVGAELFGLYLNINGWDSILHIYSGALLAMFAVVLLLNHDKYSKETRVDIVYFFIISVSFAVMIGVLWEIYEYTGDSLFGMNMQITTSYEGVVLQGQAAIYDTMKDLIIDLIGAVIGAIISIYSLKNNKGLLSDYNKEIKKSLN